MKRVILLLALLGAALAEPVTECDAGTPCVDNTKYCDLTDGSCVERSLCDPGTYAAPEADLFADTKCVACDDDCLTCYGPSDEECTSCPLGHFLQDATIEPESVTAGVPAPLLFGHCEDCTECGEGTFQTHPCTPISDTACADCPATCPPGTRSPCPAAGTGPAKACVNCGPACSACSEAACTACFPGFALQADACVACTAVLPGCAFCSLPPLGGPVCTSCLDGYYLKAGACVPNSARSPPPPPSVGVNAVRSPPPPPSKLLG